MGEVVLALSRLAFRFSVDDSVRFYGARSLVESLESGSGRPSWPCADFAHRTSPSSVPCPVSRFVFRFLINVSTSSSQKREALPRRARIQGSSTCVSLNSRLESSNE